MSVKPLTTTIQALPMTVYGGFGRKTANTAELRYHGAPPQYREAVLTEATECTGCHQTIKVGDKIIVNFTEDPAKPNVKHAEEG